MSNELSTNERQVGVRTRAQPIAIPEPIFESPCLRSGPGIDHDEFQLDAKIYFDCNCDSAADKAAAAERNGNISNDFVGDGLVLGAVIAGVEGFFYPRLHPPNSPQTPQPAYVNLASKERTKHILEGDGPGTKGGGHRFGTGKPGKSEFPEGWSDDKIMHYASDIATDPNSKTTVIGRTTIKEGVREGVDIKVVIRNGEIWTAYPTNLPRNP